MKELALIFFAALFLAAVSVPGFAGGGKNRGDKGKGTVVQHHVRK